MEASGERDKSSRIASILQCAKGRVPKTCKVDSGAFGKNMENASAALMRQNTSSWKLYHHGSSEALLMAQRIK